MSWLRNALDWLFQLAVEWLCHTCKRKTSCPPPAPMCPGCKRVMVRKEAKP